MSGAILTDQSTVKSHHGLNKSLAALSSSFDYPVLRTQRFEFRPFVLSDIAQLIAIANEHRITESAVGVPHPGTVEFARMCVSSHPTPWRSPRALQWAAVDIGMQQEGHLRKRIYKEGMLEKVICWAIVRERLH